MPSPAGDGPAAGPEGESQRDLVVVGRIGRPQGVKGEVTVEVRTDDPDARFAPGSMLQTDTGVLTVAHARDHSGKLVVLFEGVSDRNAAERLRGTMLSVDASTLPELDDEDEFYDSQLVGLAVQGRDGQSVGTVREVLHLPHGDLLVVAPPGEAQAGRQDLLIPFVRTMVPTVDLAARRVVIDPPPGLLEVQRTAGET